MDRMKLRIKISLGGLLAIGLLAFTALPASAGVENQSSLSDGKYSGDHVGWILDEVNNQAVPCTQTLSSEYADKSQCVRQNASKVNTPSDRKLYCALVKSCLLGMLSGKTHNFNTLLACLIEHGYFQLPGGEVGCNPSTTPEIKPNTE